VTSGWKRILIKHNCKLAGAVAALFIPILPAYAADCSQYVMEPEVKFEFFRPQPVYKSVPRSHIMELARSKGYDYSNATGLTNAEFFINYDFKLAGDSLVGGYCVTISEITFKMGYSNKDVLIDDRYKEGTCEYYVLRSHEAQHVKIHNDVLERYIPLIRDEILIASMNIKPMFVKSIDGTDMDRALEHVITESKNISLLVRKMRQELVWLNSEIDTQEEYARINDLCENW